MSSLIKETVLESGIVVFELEVQQKTISYKEETEAKSFFSCAMYQNKWLGSLLFHVANESDSAPQYRAKLKEMGVTSGVADYLCLVKRGNHPYAVIELKRSRKRDSKLSDEQKSFLIAAKSQGAFAAVCYGHKAALYALNKYLSLK